MFIKAKPIWIKDKSKEMNIHAVFSANVSKEKPISLHIAGTAFYRVFINDIFLAAGPARTAKGYLREDVYELDAGEYDIKIEAVGYYCKSIATVYQSSCLMAEVQCEHEVLAYTGNDFMALLPKQKIQKAERYSVQRHFTEIWDYRKESSVAEIEILDEEWKILERRAGYPIYDHVELQQAYIRGKYEFDEEIPYKKYKYSWQTVPEEWGRFEYEEIPYHPFAWVQRLKQNIQDKHVKLPLVLKKGEYVIFDFGQIEAGFIKSNIETLKESDIVIGYTELYSGDEFVFQNMNVHNVIEFFLNKNETRELLSFEPYTCRFVILAVKEGEIKLNSFGVKSYVLDTNHVKQCDCSDQMIQDIYRGAIRNYAHNEVDLYMDCPSRERAGWIGDSYFTAKGEYALTGATKTEDAFLENYRLYQNEGEFPKGAIPECYPSDMPPKGDFIPQFTMLYILEVEEYLLKRGHSDMTSLFKEQIYGLLEFYRKYENEDGLLENLPSWNFVEWGPANDWIQDVSYPTNFLYSRVLEAIGRLYDDKECMIRCEEVRKTALKQSFNGVYFLDHSKRNASGRLELQKEASEVGQYYAILFGNIDIHAEEYRELKNLILNVFSPDRNGEMPEILEFNMIMGAYMRMDLLLKMKEYELLLHDIKRMYGQMEQDTGTLWEYRIHKGSYDHGICVYVIHAIQEAWKGLKNGKEIH